MLRSRLVPVLVVVAVLLTGWSLSSERTFAKQDSARAMLFGPVAVGTGQGARINVYGVGNPNDAQWQFSVRIFNRRGEMVQARRFQLAPGVISSFEIAVQDEENFPVDRLGRRTLRAEIVGFNPQPDPPGRFAATLEVYSQRTGHTSIVIGDPDILPAVSPPPEPDSQR